MAPLSFPKLNQQNYQQWALNMEARLRTSYAWRIVNGSETRPEPTLPLDAAERKEVRDFDQRTDLAAGEIWDCVEQDQQVHLQEIRDDPCAMWAKLKSVHLQKRPGARFTTYDALLGLQCTEGESLSSLAARATQLKQNMKLMRPAAFTVSQLDDELVLMALIRALPSQYAPLKQTTLLDDSLTLDKLMELFVALENQPGAGPS
ncbi:hypothetical protein GLOTRDRAFT_51687, partial [Gloeophyllum trabeum ATCC 11539]